MLPGEKSSPKSVDSIISQDEVINKPTEFFNILEPTVTAPHNLLLKFGAPIMQPS